MLSSRPISIHRDYYDISEAPSKTPGRSLKGRTGLQENALHLGSLTANPKEKRAILQTPFKRDVTKNALQDSINAKGKFVINRPLVDKTPLPNRQNLVLLTPAPQKGKMSQTTPISHDEVENLSPARPPSSSRRSLRAPRSSLKNYETPATKGDHWNVSDISINIEETTLEQVNEMDTDETDYSEPEYMPPKQIALPYDPPFDMPNYSYVGGALMDLAHSYFPDEYNSRPKPDMEISDDYFSPDVMHLFMPEIEEDDLFLPLVNKVKESSPRRPSTLKHFNSATRTSRDQIHVRPPRVQPARPATSIALRAPTSKRIPSVPRPGTSASNKRPVQTSNHALTNPAASKSRGIASYVDKHSSQVSRRAPTMQKNNEQLDDDLVKSFVKDWLSEDTSLEKFRFEL